MKVLILADSLALPRQEADGVTPYEETYPYLLDQSLRRQFREHAPVVIERGMRRRTIEYVLDDWLEMVELRRPEVVVVHVGVVDCAPRVFLRREARMVAKLRPAPLRNFILNFVHRHRRRIISLRRRVYVPQERFRQLVNEVVQKARASQLRSLVFVNIITPPDEMEARSPGFQQNVAAYNQILRDQINSEWIHLIDLNTVIQERGGARVLTVDGIHLNAEGHRLLAASLEEHIQNLLGQDSALSTGAFNSSREEARLSR